MNLQNETLKTIYRKVEFIIQQAFIAVVLYVFTSAIVSLIRTIESIWIDFIIIIVSITLFKELIVKKIANDEPFGKYSYEISLIIIVIIALILLNTIGVPKVSL